jgi:hypothetical protein
VAEGEGAVSVIVGITNASVAVKEIVGAGSVDVCCVMDGVHPESTPSKIPAILVSIVSMRAIRRVSISFLSTVGL